MKNYDAIIIGAGLAGLQCARLLGQRGLSVLLVDRKNSLETSIHTTGIFVRRTLEDFDIPADCLGPAVSDVTLYSPSRRAMDLKSDHEEFRIGRVGRLYTHYREAREVERRGGRIPVGGVLRKIASNEGLLIGDAAGAVSPLTAGGLDPCMRLSTLAARAIAEYLETGNAEVLKAYSGELFRARFASRLWMRRLVSSVREPALVELACAGIRLPVVNWFAWHVFFGRGSFPDMDPHWTQQTAV